MTNEERFTKIIMKDTTRTIVFKDIINTYEEVAEALLGVALAWGWNKRVLLEEFFEIYHQEFDDKVPMPTDKDGGNW